MKKNNKFKKSDFCEEKKINFAKIKFFAKKVFKKKSKSLLLMNKVFDKKNIIHFFANKVNEQKTLTMSKN